MGEEIFSPLVGITISKYKSKIARFFDWLSLRRQGARTEFIVPGSPVDFEKFDGLVIGGGDDIGADIYGGEINIDVRIDPDRDALELELLKRAEAEKLPVLGICRGAQMMNIHFGGSLFTDIRKMKREKTGIRTVLAKKAVNLLDGSKIKNIMKKEVIRVNSLHHQAIDRLGKGLEITGRDRGDFVQAIEHQKLPFFVGVQWHPEFLVLHREHQNIFAAFVEATKSKRTLGEPLP